jgi:hypothetical protein
MTDTVIDGGAPAPAEPIAAPITEPVAAPTPLGTQTPPATEKPDAPIEEPAKTPREALQKAMDKVKAGQEAKEPPKAEAKPVEAKEAPKVDAKAEKPAEPVKPATERAPDGKFVAKEAAQPAEQTNTPAQPGIHEAPARIDAAAKAEWANVPEPVKGAIHRTIREMETGLEEHRQRWEPIKRYDDMAKQYGTDLPSALERYVAMDTLLNEDIAQGIDSIIRDKTSGQMGLREFIGQLTGQQPDQAQSQNDATIHALRQEIAALKQDMGNVTGHMQAQSAKAIEADVLSFSQGKPDFEALAPKIAEHIKAGKDLPSAYETAKQEMAEIARSLGFVPAQTTQQPLKPAGQKSITGAPSTGSDPASITKNAPVPSIREALKRGFARVGA